MSGLQGVVDDLMLVALKVSARTHYERYERLVGEMSCGRTIAEHISADVQEAKRLFNETMDKIAARDPKAPAFRL